MAEDTLEAGLGHQQAGRLADAEAVYRLLLSHQPDRAPALHFLGLLLNQTGRRDEAMPVLRRSLELEPEVADFQSNFATVLVDLGQWNEAIVHLQKAIELRPDFAEAHFNLGFALQYIGRLEDAVRQLRKAISLRSAHLEAYQRLGDVLRELGRNREAVAAYTSILRQDPASGQAYHSMAVGFEGQGKLREALACYRRSITLCANSAWAESDLLLAMHYDARTGNDPRALFEAHTAWAERHAEPLYPSAVPVAHVGCVNRRLRIGYVSPDFRSHPIGRLIAPALSHHDRERFEIVCYADVKRPDVFTERLRQKADLWRDTTALSDEALAEAIREDRIDLLIDLTGHMALRRLFVFARKPAPVQVAYLGYPDTTGLSTMDWRITDAWHDPLGESDPFNTERLWRLPDGCWCYDPTELDPRGDASLPPVAPPPAELNAQCITFGSLNRSIKTTMRQVELWARILMEVPHSQLLLLAGPDEEEAVAELFGRMAVFKGRLRLAAKRSRRDYLKLFDQVDIHLDTFPYNGHTTTLDAMWMGVPTVSLTGKTHVARAGLSVLSAVGLESLAAQTPDAYVNSAVSLAHDRPALKDLRASLRARMKDSILLDGARFTRSLDRAFYEMWKGNCGTTSGPTL